MFKHFSLPRLGRELLRLWPYLELFLVSAAVIAFAYGLIKVIPPVVTFTQKMLLQPESFLSFTKNPAAVLRSTSDRTNILLMGMRGQGDLLTDSLMLFSYHHKSKQLTLISIPRDLWVDSLKAKINTAFYYGEQKKPGGGGLDLSASAVSETLGLPIHYSVAINFEGFRQAIDLVGGIDLTVDRTFDDYKYPIPGKETALPEASRYEHLHFDAGPQHLDGDLALKFVRSRFAEGEEGTDFARSARQQKVIAAFQRQLLDQKILLDSAKVSQLTDLYHQYIITDINSADYGAFARLFLDASSHPFRSLDITPILYHPKDARAYLGQWVLLPRDNNWKALHQFIQNELNK